MNKHGKDNEMDSQVRVLSVPAKFIRIGASLQFLLFGIGLCPPLGRWIMRLIHGIDSIEVQEALGYAVFLWIIGAPIIGIVAYTRLSTEEKTGTEGLLLLFWWISLFVMLAVAASLGAGL